MAFLRNIFKKKTTARPPRPPRPLGERAGPLPKETPVKPIKKPKEEISLEKPVETKPKARKEKIISQAPERSEGERRTNVLRAPIILRSPHITEKATDLVKKNQYVFKVVPKTNKTEIKRAIENLYGVDVLNVRVLNIPKKQRRLGRQTGWRKGYKKAIVKIKEGQKIEVLPR